jgi:membrane protease YdiL (CAAX protease family)
LLFYIKRFLSLEIAVTLLLGGLGYWGIWHNRLPLILDASPREIVLGVAGSLWLAVWTLLVQSGYSVTKGRAYAQDLTASLAKVYVGTGVAQIIFGGVTAACGEELFFRGFLQQRFGIVAASLLFMLSHFWWEGHPHSQLVVNISSFVLGIVFRVVEEFAGPHDRPRTL